MNKSQSWFNITHKTYTQKCYVQTQPFGDRLKQSCTNELLLFQLNWVLDKSSLKQLLLYKIFAVFTSVLLKTVLFYFFLQRIKSAEKCLLGRWKRIPSFLEILSLPDVTVERDAMQVETSVIMHSSRQEASNTAEAQQHSTPFIINVHEFSKIRNTIRNYLDLCLKELLNHSLISFFINELFIYSLSSK